DLGEYEYKLVVIDESSNEAYDILDVFVLDTTAPTVSHPSDLEINFGFSNIIILWDVYDLRPDTFELFRDGTLVASGILDNDVNITHTIPSTLASGTYEYTLIVEDISGNTRTDTVMVYVLNPTGGFDFLTIGLTIGGIAVIIIVGGALVCKRGSDAAIGGDFAYG
ncbi:MAG: hypothetical protein KAQ65_03700, partial [Candidatus Thorarchaeota archaeon]|nr:hypothetical protein [Candidatus Thorarchaeota archaeon]